MKKLLLFLLLICITTISNTALSATKSQFGNNYTKEVFKSKVQICSKDQKLIDAATASEFAKVQQASSNLGWLCFVTDVSLEYIGTSPDGTDWYNVIVTVTCYHYDSPLSR
jgi:hypothetical protein